MLLDLEPYTVEMIIAALNSVIDDDDTSEALTLSALRTLKETRELLIAEYVNYEFDQADLVASDQELQ